MATSAACAPRLEKTSPRMRSRRLRESRKTLRSTAILRATVDQSSSAPRMGTDVMSQPAITADPLAQLAFELDGFRWAGEERLEVTGRWFGVRGRRFVRPTLTLRAGGRRRRLIAVLEHKPWAAVEDGAWTAAFAWRGAREDI